MTVQKKVIDAFVKSLKIGASNSALGLAAFAKDIYNDGGTMVNEATALAKVDLFLDRPFERIFYTNFIPIFEHAMSSNMPRDSTIVIVSDGRPFTPKYKGSSKSTTISCNARQQLRYERPDIKVLCFGSEKSKATKFFKCACDAIWGSKKGAISTKGVVDAMNNVVCSKYSERNDPCVEITKPKKCGKVKTGYMGYASTGLLDVVSKRCHWIKSDKLCKELNSNES